MRASLAVLVGVLGCESASEPPVTEPPRATGERIAVPTIARGDDKARPAVRPAGPDEHMYELTMAQAELTIDHTTTAAGVEATARIAVTPAAGYKVSTDYPTQLTLKAPAGVWLAKAQLRAGGLDAHPGDAEIFGERKLAFAVKATADQPGTYTITGSLHFGLCDRGSCHEKREPIALEVVVN
jgi:hypothetical protein